MPDTETLAGSHEAERALLAALLLDESGSTSFVFDLITPEDFASEANRLAYRGMLRVRGNHRLVEPVSLIDALRGTGDLDKAGGATYIASLLDGNPAAT